MSEVAYDEYRRGQYDTSGGYDGPPVGTGYFPPEFRLPVATGTFQSPIGIPAPPIFPTVVVRAPATPTGDSADAADEDSALPDFEDAWVIPPEWQRRRTVYESAPGGIYETNRAPTDWDRVYDEYVVLNEPEVEEDVPFHSGIIDWGVEVISGVAGGILDPIGVGEAIRTSYAPSWLTGPTGTTVTGEPSLGQQRVGVTSMAACPPTGPRYGKICLATGEVTPLRRRRRRRLLTSSDIKDLAALKAIVGGAALQGAVVQAIRR